MKTIISLFSIIICFYFYPLYAQAQIGYQVSLLNTATGEPRANVTVTAAVTITDSANKVIYSGTQQATSNDFGVLSLTVGDANTFSNTDWSKLPLYISVTVDGVLIGKSQILSVPVAEVAKAVVPELTVEKLVGTWSGSWSSRGPYSTTYTYTYTFYTNNTCEFVKVVSDQSGTYTYNATYKYVIIGGHTVFVYDVSYIGGDWETYLDDYAYIEYVNGNLFYKWTLKKQ